MKPTTIAPAPVSEADIEGLRADTHAMTLWRVQTQTRRAEDAALKATVRTRRLSQPRTDSTWRPFWERASRLEGK